MQSEYFQDYMPGNVCFGCGSLNPDGLQIKSRWEGDEGVCVWHSQPKYHGWETVMNGGVLATLIDCHCMGTALAAAYQAEGREMATEPVYRYATVRISVNYLKPTPNDKPVELRARVLELKGRKATLACQVFADGQITADAEVVGIRVLEGEAKEGSPFR
jgi:acyl-coenzyme A thioesterase PaaI-like protein